MSRKIAYAIVLVIVVTLAATWVWALEESVTYYACVNNESGIMRMVNAEEICNKNETLIDWNQVGPQGPIGPQGPKGDTGPAGADGESWYEAQITNRTYEFTIPGNTNLEAAFGCNQGETILSGGYEVLNPSVIQVTASFPLGNLWLIYFNHEGPETDYVIVYAKCAQPSNMSLTEADESGENTLTIYSVTEIPIPPE